MNLAVDVGNSNIVIGLFEGERLLSAHRAATDRAATDFQYAVLLKNALAASHAAPEEIRGGIISSVVPPLTNILKLAVRIVADVTPLIVGPGVKTGLNILIDNPKQLGSDMVVDADGKALFRKFSVAETGPRLPPVFQRFRPAPVGGGDGVENIVARLIADTISVLVKLIDPVLLCTP